VYLFGIYDEGYTNVTHVVLAEIYTISISFIVASMDSKLVSCFFITKEIEDIISKSDPPFVTVENVDELLVFANLMYAYNDRCEHETNVRNIEHGYFDELPSLSSIDDIPRVIQSGNYNLSLDEAQELFSNRKIVSVKHNIVEAEDSDHALVETKITFAAQCSILIFYYRIKSRKSMKRREGVESHTKQFSSLEGKYILLNTYEYQGFNRIYYSEVPMDRPSKWIKVERCIIFSNVSMLSIEDSSAIYKLSSIFMNHKMRLFQRMWKKWWYEPDEDGHARFASRMYEEDSKYAA